MSVDSDSRKSSRSLLTELAAAASASYGFMKLYRSSLLSSAALSDVNAAQTSYKCTVFK